MESSYLLKITSLICMLMLLTSCFPINHWPEERAQVIDIETNQPVEGVIVVAFWKGTTGVAGTQTTCYHTESATTDAKGQFVIPGYNDGFRQGFTANKYTVLHFYKRGYKEYVRPDGMSFTQKKIYRMEPFKGTREERFEYIRRFPTSCYKAGDSKKNLYQIRKAKYEEARQLAKTKEEIRTVETMLYKIERIEYDYETATKRHYERLEALK